MRIEIQEFTHSIKQYKGSKEARSLIGNFSWLAVLQIASYLFPLITMPYLARVIGVDGFGKIAFANAVMVWILTVTDWGFCHTATRDIARNKNNKDQLSEIYSNVQYARILLMMISLMVLVLLIFIIPTFREAWVVLLVTFLTVPGHILFPDWYFQGVERMKFTTILNVVSKTVFTIAVFVFIHDKDDYIIQPLLVSLGFLCAGVAAQYIILKRWGIRLCKPCWGKIKKEIVSASDIFINSLMPNLFNSFSIVLLGFLGGVTSNGLLDAGRRFVNIGQNVTSTITRAFYPFLSRRIDKHSFYVRVSIGIATLISVGLFIFAPLIIKVFFGPEFESSILVLRISSLGIIFTAFSSAYGTGYMILQGYERKLRNITTICSMLGFALAFPFIYYFDYIGASINIVVSQFLLGGAIALTGYRIKHHKINK